MASREWLTRGEIQGIVADEGREIRAQQQQFQAKFEETVEKLVDGATASLTLTAILTGMPEYGVKGALPDIQERLAALESKVDAVEARGVKTEETVETHHLANTKRFDTLEGGQHRIQRFLTFIANALFMDDKGRPDWKRIWAMIVATGGGLHLLFWPSQSFVGVKKLMLIVNHWMGN